MEDFSSSPDKGHVNGAAFNIGEEKRDFIIEGECSKILVEKELSLDNASFLIQMGRIDDAEEYFIAHQGQINGQNLGALLALASFMVEEKRYVSASIIYRALLTPILERAKLKEYHHGVRYLKKLDILAPEITNWKGIMAHKTYLKGLQEKRNLKVSFWERYKE